MGQISFDGSNDVLNISSYNIIMISIYTPTHLAVQIQKVFLLFKNMH